MKNIRISLVAAFYKDLTALALIIDSLRVQNYNNFELIVAEDNDAPATRDFLGGIKDIDIIHTSQADNGNQKARSLNNAILASTGDYLVFIDADCIPCKNLLQAHASLAEAGNVLSGRRVNLGPRMSNLLRSRKLNIRTIEHYYLFFATPLLLDGATHIDQGLNFNLEIGKFGAQGADGLGVEIMFEIQHIVMEGRQDGLHAFIRLVHTGQHFAVTGPGLF